jgi:hypothetical protein
MTFKDFKDSLRDHLPPERSSELLKALWYDAKGNWNRAHEVAQEVNTEDGAWVHAYLHRKEGDASNAAYWYYRAHQKLPAVSLETEWETIVKSLMNGLL